MNCFYKCKIPRISNIFYSDDNDGQKFLQKLSQKVNRPLQISFRDMLKLMRQCNQVEENNMVKKIINTRSDRLSSNEGEKQTRKVEKNRQQQDTSQQLNPLTILNGVVPGIFC